MSHDDVGQGYVIRPKGLEFFYSRPERGGPGPDRGDHQSLARPSGAHRDQSYDRVSRIQSYNRVSHILL